MRANCAEKGQSILIYFLLLLHILVTTCNNKVMDSTLQLENKKATVNKAPLSFTKHL